MEADENRWMLEISPLYQGRSGKAWKFPLPTGDDDWRLQVALDANFLIFAPSAHPAWSWHLILGVALRDVPGRPPAHRRYAEATHELMVFALDPAHPPPDATEWPMPADPAAPRPLHLLSPPDAVIQFHVGSDEHATEIVHLAANACTTGHLIPDSDHAGAWQAAIATTAEHYRAGLHG